MFYAKTKHANKLKALFELLFNNLKRACFTIDKSGIHLNSNTTINLMLEVNLLAEQFDEYVFTFEEPLHIGIESYISKSFKTMKNKNTVSLSILNPGVLLVEVKSIGKDEFGYSIEVATEKVQNVSLCTMHSYLPESQTTIPNSRFSDMCKLIKPISEFSVMKEKELLKFTCRTQDIYTETFKFGEENINDKTLIHHVHKSEQLFRISKIVSFSKDQNKVIDVYVEKDKPLMISAMCEIGIIKAYFL